MKYRQVARMLDVGGLVPVAFRSATVPAGAHVTVSASPQLGSLVPRMLVVPPFPGLGLEVLRCGTYCLTPWSGAQISLHAELRWEFPEDAGMPAMNPAVGAQLVLLNWTSRSREFRGASIWCEQLVRRANG